MNRPNRSSIACRAGGLISATAFALASCGTAELEVDETFDDTWSVIELTIDDAPIGLDGQDIEIEIDTGQAAVRGQTRCRPFFGSYTLTGPDEQSSGEASFTIPSPSASEDCPAADRRVHTDLIEALETVTQWRREGPSLTLSSPSGSLIVLEGQNQTE